MKKHLVIIGLISVVLIGSLSGCVGPEVIDYFNGEYSINAQTIVSVSNINGQIEITGWDGDNVSVYAVKKSTFGEEDLDKANISVTQTEITLKSSQNIPVRNSYKQGLIILSKYLTIPR